MNQSNIICLKKITYFVIIKTTRSNRIRLKIQMVCKTNQIIYITSNILYIFLINARII